MPYTLEYENESHGVRIIFTGEVNGPDIFSVTREIDSREKLLARKYEVWDFTAAIYLDIEKAEMLRLARLAKRAAAINPDIFVAYVGSDDFFYHADTIYEMHTQDLNMKLKRFTTAKDAYHWIHSYGTAD